MAELESMKYLSSEFLESDENLNQPAPAPREPQRLVTASERGMAEWSVGLTLVVAYFAIGGLWAVIGGGMDLYNAMNAEEAVVEVQQVIGMNPTGEFKVLLDTMQRQVDNIWIFYLVGVVRILVGVSLLVAAASLRNRQEDANRFSAMVCLGSLFYSFLAIYSTWFLVPELSAIEGISENEAGVANSLVLGVMVFSFLVAAVIQGGLIAYLMNKNNRKLFGGRSPEVVENYSQAGYPAV